MIGHKAKYLCVKPVAVAEAGDPALRTPRFTMSTLCSSQRSPIRFTTSTIPSQSSVEQYIIEAQSVIDFTTRKSFRRKR